MITASLRNYRIAPRKIRLVADMVRGKNVNQAKLILAHALKKGKHPISDLIDSAIANAVHNHKLDAENLYIKSITIDPGQILRRFRPVSRGSAHPIKKKTSHVNLVLAPAVEKVQAAKPKEKAAKKKTENK